MPLTHLLDTSVYSQPIRKSPLPSVQRRWAMVGDRAIVTSVICEAEVLQGLEAKRSGRLWAAYDGVLKGRIPLLPVGARIASRYARLHAEFERNGRRRPAFDLLIAVTALVHDLTLATCNVWHFDGIEGLAVEDWSQDSNGERRAVSG